MWDIYIYIHHNDDGHNTDRCVSSPSSTEGVMRTQTLRSPGGSPGLPKVLCFYTWSRTIALHNVRALPAAGASSLLVCAFPVHSSQTSPNKDCEMSDLLLDGLVFRPEIIETVELVLKKQLPTYQPTYQLTSLPPCLLPSLPTCLPTYLPPAIPPFLPPYLPTCLFPYLLTHPSTYLPTYQPTNLPTSLLTHPPT